MHKKTPGVGRPAKFVTWFSLWMEMKGYSLKTMAELTCYSITTIENWRRGESLSRHSAQIMRARWEDCPVHRYGGPSPFLREKLPVNSRTPEMYRMLLKVSEIAGYTFQPVDIARARGIPLQPE